MEKEIKNKKLNNEEYKSDLKIGDFAYNREKRRQVEKPMKVVGFKRSFSGIRFVLMDSGHKIYSEPEILCDKWEPMENSEPEQN